MDNIDNMDNMDNMDVWTYRHFGKITYKKDTQIYKLLYIHIIYKYY